MHMSHKTEFTLGIYGDGQLARLLAASASKRNISTLIYTLNEKDSPCRGVAPLMQGLAWNDSISFKKFSNQCRTIVLENEFVPASFLIEAEKNGHRILPSAASFEQVSNKLKQVKLADALGIKTPKYTVISEVDQLLQLDLPVMLKSLTGGYDGYGNYHFKSLTQLEEAQNFITKQGPALAQEFIYFEQEVAVLVVGDGKDYFPFPVVETVQEKNICHFVLIPPRFSESLQTRIKHQAMQLIKAIGGVGIFGVEFFISGEEIIFNEIAPRPHNSGHYSIEACSYSQFDALVKLLLHEPLSTPELKTPAAAMLNLLGTQNGKAHFQGDEEFNKNPQGFLHLYGKEDSRIGRKMGHFTLLGNDQDALLKTLTNLKMRYQI
jgi:5-(carboxyamino)imidazole ribonucleotide synthase